MTKKRVYRHREEREELIDQAVAELATTKQGPFILLPSLTEIVEHTGIAKGSLARDGIYPSRVEVATGMKVVHRGLVLGEPEVQSPVDAVMTQLDSLSDEERSHVIGRIALNDRRQ